MIEAFLTLGSGALCALGYRLRGSALWSRWTGRGVGTARIVAWGGACGLSAAGWVFLDGRPAWWLPPVVLVSAWLGATPPQWKSIDMGRREGTLARDLPVQSLRGLLGVAGIAALFWLAGNAFWPILAAGALAGPLYAEAWRLDVKTPHPELDEPPEWGELAWGLAVGLGMSAGMILGEAR